MTDDRVENERFRLQASQRDYDGRTIYRWFVFCTTGRKIVWAESAQAAAAKCEAAGLMVESVDPAPSGAMPL